MLKRLIDIVISLSALLLLVPPLAVLSVLIAVKMGRPVLFSQQRPGLDGRIFRMYKLRSMTDERDAKGELLSDEKRLTAFGKFLRASSLDELPSLWNILNGDMSLIGPRPLLVEYLPLYSDEQARRHDCRPGLTGWAQVNGRNTVDWAKRFELDVWYVDNQSLLLDIKILLLTIKKVLIKEGINQQGEATMTKFTGNTDE